ncbi:hypothetical protein D3P08_23750 [Paenibacillus nanensis]|uniref:Uncharacterized protein n=1 Tax=Paenibacillus nanensis TaxID=393251 RepID=A0A3A1ULT3_9BACL|nr:hypothetical protein [Paenibacillus nanensis]RIX48714.1 hypothetical protein D3P08_23750 [Paenibacillus nanensis]
MKWKLIIASAVLLIAAIILFFRQYDGKPGPLPDDAMAAAEINEALSVRERRGAEAEQILDRIKLDKRHAFIPYISKGGYYAVSFWVWEKRKWRVGRIDTDSGPHIWKLSPNDPSRYYLVWNIRPQGEIEDFSFYFIRQRNAGRSDGIDYYTPRIQLEQPVDFGKQPYGAIPYPDHWAKLLREEQRMSRTRGLFSFEYRENTSIYWLPVLADNPPRSGGFSTFGTSFLESIRTDFVNILNENELERP